MIHFRVQGLGVKGLGVRGYSLEFRELGNGSL